MKKPYRGALSEPIKRQKPANALRELYEQARKWGALFARGSRTATGIAGDGVALELLLAPRLRIGPC